MLIYKLEKFIYKFNIFFFRILVRFFVEIYKFILKFIWKDIDFKVFKILLRENEVVVINFLILRFIIL